MRMPRSKYREPNHTDDSMRLPKITGNPHRSTSRSNSCDAPINKLAGQEKHPFNTTFTVNKDMRNVRDLTLDAISKSQSVDSIALIKTRVEHRRVEPLKLFDRGHDSNNSTRPGSEKLPNIASKQSSAKSATGSISRAHFELQKYKDTLDKIGGY